MDKVDIGVSQLQQVLEAFGGVASLRQMEKEFKKMHLVDFDDEWRREHFDLPEIKRLTRKKAFNKVIELTVNPKIVFRLYGHTGPPPITPKKKTVAKGRMEILRVFDALDGKCTVEAFKDEYLRQFDESFAKAAKKYFHPIEEIGGFLGQEVIVTLESEGPTFTLPNKEYEGRRRMELDESYRKLFASSFSSKLEEYFGTESLEQAIPKFSKKVLPIKKTEEKGLAFVLKPNFAGVQKQFEKYKAGIAKDKISSYEDLFFHQCIFSLRNVNSAIRKCEQPATFESVIEYFDSGGGCRGFAGVLTSNHPKLLKFMVPEKAWLFPSEMPPAAVFQTRRKPRLNRMVKRATTAKPGNSAPLTQKEFFNRVVSIVRGCDDDVLLNHFSSCYKTEFGSEFASDWPRFYPSAESMLELSEQLTDEKLSVTKYNSTWRFLYSDLETKKEMQLGKYWDLETQIKATLDGKKSRRSNFSHLV